MQLVQYVEFVTKVLNTTLGLNNDALRVIIVSSAEVRTQARALAQHRLSGEPFFTHDVRAEQISKGLRLAVNESYEKYKSLGVRKIEVPERDFLPSDAAKILLKSIELPGSGLAFDARDPFTQERAVQVLISFEMILINILLEEVLNRDPITLPERKIA